MPLLILILLLFYQCTSESCKINYELHSEKYDKALSVILEMNLVMNSIETHYRPVLKIDKDDNLLDTSLFDEIEFVECHEDSTIIFQAPNCEQENALRDVVYILVYSPKGIKHIKGKRNIGKIEVVGDNWYLCKHIYSIAV